MGVNLKHSSRESQVRARACACVFVMLVWQQTQYGQTQNGALRAKLAALVAPKGGGAVKGRS